MPVFDFSHDDKADKTIQPDYSLIFSNEKYADQNHPIMILKDDDKTMSHHASGLFTSPAQGLAFKSDQGDKLYQIISIDARFEPLLKWIGDNHIMVRLTCALTEEGCVVYRIEETGVAVRGSKLSGENGFLQFMIQRPTKTVWIQMTLTTPMI